MNQTNFIELLSNFVEQRPGFDWANYDSMRSYRSDYLPTLKDKKTFFDLVEFGLRCFGFEQLNNKLGQYLSDSRKRLTYTDSGLQYCTGQYYPVEYRAAAKNAIFYCIWDLVCENYPQYETGEQIRQFFKRETRNREILRLTNW